MNDISNQQLLELLIEENNNIRKCLDLCLKRIETIEKECTLTRKRQLTYRDEIHKHIDITYRDLMVVLEKQQSFTGKQEYYVETEYPCAEDSLDHLYPTGTAKDNTRYPRFVRKCEELFEGQLLAFLDLGCSGGGMVLDAILRGHYAIGLEGSDYSLKRQRAEWRLLRNNLFTCDITKPFFILSMMNHKERKLFNIITAWEVLEHISEDSLEGLLSNIKNHLSDEGLFVASISVNDSIPKQYGVDLHVTKHTKDWWINRFVEAGFLDVSDLFTVEDMPRGGINPSNSFKAEIDLKKIDFDNNFFIAMKKG